jgi:carboxylesterase type B
MGTGLAARATKLRHGRRQDRLPHKVEERQATRSPAPLPHWAAYEAEKRPTMLFDLKTRVENDPAKEVRLLWDELRPA